MTYARLGEYRQHCVAAEQKAQDDFDKAILSLSGGGLAISFAFIKDLVGTGPLLHPSRLFIAWLAWAGSIVATLSSYFFSQQALRTAIKQVDDEKIAGEHPGKAFARATAALNIAAGLLFLAGVVFVAWFVYVNLG